MKAYIPLCLLIISLFACSKDDPIITTENEDYYICDNFFETGNYTSFCTIETEIVNISSETIDGGGTVCRYIIPALDYDKQSDSAVSFTSLEKSSQSINLFSSLKSDSETAAENDSLIFHTNMTINGHDAYIAEGRFANHTKTVIVRYKNVLVTTRALYFKDWYSEDPCNYETDQLVDLMSIVLDNM